jgi:hypothetical protein
LHKVIAECEVIAEWESSAKHLFAREAALMSGRWENIDVLDPMTKVESDIECPASLY